MVLSAMNDVGISGSSDTNCKYHRADTHNEETVAWFRLSLSPLSRARTPGNLSESHLVVQKLKLKLTRKECSRSYYQKAASW